MAPRRCSSNSRTRNLASRHSPVTLRRALRPHPHPARKRFRRARDGGLAIVMPEDEARAVLSPAQRMAARRQNRSFVRSATDALPRTHVQHPSTKEDLASIATERQRREKRLLEQLDRLSSQCVAPSVSLNPSSRGIQFGMRDGASFGRLSSSRGVAPSVFSFASGSPFGASRSGLGLLAGGNCCLPSRTNMLSVQ